MIKLCLQLVQLESGIMWKKLELRVITFVAYVLMRVIQKLCWMMVRRMPLEIGLDGKEKRTGARLGNLVRRLDDRRS